MGLVPFIGPILEIGSKLIDKLFPDPTEKARAQLELMKLQQNGELAQLQADLQLAMSQLEVNKIEAGSGSLFRGGWRPSVGWICAFALFYQMSLRPVFTWLGPLIGLPAGMPSLELDTLMTLLFGMLGLGAYRTYEKVKGNDK